MCMHACMCACGHVCVYLCICACVYVHVFKCRGKDWYIDTSDFPMMATSSSQFPS